MDYEHIPMIFENTYPKNFMVLLISGNPNKHTKNRFDKFQTYFKEGVSNSNSFHAKNVTEILIFPNRSISCILKHGSTNSCIYIMILRYIYMKVASDMKIHIMSR